MVYIFSTDYFDAKYILELRQDVDVKNSLELHGEVDLFCRTQFSRSICRLLQPLIDANIKRVVASIESAMLTQ